MTDKLSHAGGINRHYQCLLHDVDLYSYVFVFIVVVVVVATLLTRLLSLTSAKELV